MIKINRYERVRVYGDDMMRKRKNEIERLLHVSIYINVFLWYKLI